MTEIKENIYDPRYIYKQIFGSRIVGHAQHWPDINLQELKSINPYTVGWIHMDKSPINYPIVHELIINGNNYFLSHNFSGETSRHGAVTLSNKNRSTICDKNLVFQAHHMKDWSMFKCIVSFDEQTYFEEHPIISLLFEEGRYDVEIFSSYPRKEDDSSGLRTVFEDGDDYEKWLSSISEKSHIKSAILPTVSDRIASFDTCCYLDGYPNFTVHGIIREFD